jgi:hypothetical protein
MRALDKTAWEILNATADDWENLEQIYHMICFDFSPEQHENRDRGTYYLRTAKGAPSLEQVADRILQLVEDGLLAARGTESEHAVSDSNDCGFVWRAWFRMTPAGRSAWDSSDYANLVEHEQPK